MWRCSRERKDFFGGRKKSLVRDRCHRILFSSFILIRFSVFLNNLKKETFVVDFFFSVESKAKKKNLSSTQTIPHSNQVESQKNLFLYFSQTRNFLTPHHQLCSFHLSFSEVETTSKSCSNRRRVSLIEISFVWKRRQRLPHRIESWSIETWEKYTE